MSYLAESLLLFSLTVALSSSSTLCSDLIRTCGPLSVLNITVNCLESSAFVHWNTLYDDHDVDLLNLEYTCYNELNVPLDGFPKVFKPCTQANSGWSMELNETGHHCVYGGCAKLFEDRGCSFQMNRLNATCSFGSLGMSTSMSEIMQTTPIPLQVSSWKDIVTTQLTVYNTSFTSSIGDSHTNGSVTSPIINTSSIIVIVTIILLVCISILVCAVLSLYVIVRRKMNHRRSAMIRNVEIFPDFDNISTTGSIVTVIQSLEPCHGISVYNDDIVCTNNAIKQYTIDDSTYRINKTLAKEDDDHMIEEKLSVNNGDRTSEISQENLHTSIHPHKIPGYITSDKIIINYNLNVMDYNNQRYKSSVSSSSGGYLYY